MAASDNEIIRKLEQRISKLERQMRELQSMKTVGEVRLNTEEAAKYIGLTGSGLRRLTSNKLIPFYKPSGKRIYFIKDELDEWMKSSHVKPK